MVKKSKFDVTKISPQEIERHLREAAQIISSCDAFVPLSDTTLARHEREGAHFESYAETYYGVTPGGVWQLSGERVLCESPAD